MSGFNFTDRVRTILQLAREEAARLHHEYVGTEHILLGVVREGQGVASAVLANLGVDGQDVQRAIEAIVKQGKSVGTNPDLPYTSRAKKVLELSMSAARELNHSYVGSEHILLGLLREEKGIAAQVLNQAGITFDVARADILRLLALTPETVSSDAGRRVAVAGAAVDQPFKTAVALIELHQRRFGVYPDSLNDLQFVGNLDRVLLKGLSYEKLADGYALEIAIGGAKPGLSYPPEFWRGLRIRRTNVEGYQ